MDAFKNPVVRKVKNGDKVIVRGPISLYAKRGTFQIICKRIVPYGKGDLKAQYEFLKEKLRVEGLFEAEVKKEIPNLPKRIAVITALGGAALQDFLNIIKRRSIWLDVLIVPATVQGDDCAPSVIKALKRIQNIASIDTVVITRGGGAMEDLWGFNDENLVRTVFNYPIPVISAIGHQVDYTLLDYVSDMRLETPSAAAEVLSQEQTLLKQRLEQGAKELKNLFNEFKYNLQQRIERVNPTQFLMKLQTVFRGYEQRLLKLRLFESEDPIGLLDKQRFLDELVIAFQNGIRRKLESNAQRLEMSDKLLNSLDPNNVLGRGYSYLKSQSGHVISDVERFDNLSDDDTIQVYFKDGQRKVAKVGS